MDYYYYYYCVIPLLSSSSFFIFFLLLLSCRVQAENSHPFQAFRGDHGGNALRGRRRWRIHSLRQPEACTGNHGERRFAKPEEARRWCETWKVL